jgi:hypothetical protein
MEFIQRRLVALLVSLTVGLASLPAHAEQLSDDPMALERPSAAAMAADALVARPVLLGLTVAGTGLFVLTLPFSALGGNTGEAAKMLVVGPAKSTFLRCLGCTETQDRWKTTVAGEEAQQ